MTRYKFLVGTAAVAFLLSVTPAWSQGRPGGGGGGGGGEGRPGGGGGAGAGPSGGSGGGGGGGSMSSGGGGSSSSASSGGGGSSASDAPSRPSNSENSRVREGAPQRRSGDGVATGQRAVPRGSSGEPRGASRVPSATPSTGGSDRVNASADRGNPSSRAVPTYSRPREGRPVVGQAVERTGRPGGGGFYPVRPSYPYYPYYPYYGYGNYYWPSYGYGFGLGFYYDPFWYDPYYYGGGYGGGYGAYSSGSASYGRRDTGALRLKIKPRNAQVLVDGYFVGTIDGFDGIFQKLDIDAGSHRIEIKADGYEPLQFEVLITPGETATYKGELKRIQ